MRRTPTTLAVITELLTDIERPRWSYEIARRLNVDRGSVVTILRRASNLAWLSESWEQEDPSTLGRPPRHLYTVADADKLREFVAPRARNKAG